MEGYNDYLRKTGTERLPKACRDAAWVRQMTYVDALRLNEEKMRLAGSEDLLAAVVAATPPNDGVTGAIQSDYKEEDAFSRVSTPALGSNGWAFGRDATGRTGLLLGNPHFPWTTTNRFWQVHQTIPGRGNPTTTAPVVDSTALGTVTPACVDARAIHWREKLSIHA